MSYLKRRRRMRTFLGAIVVDITCIRTRGRGGIYTHAYHVEHSFSLVYTIPSFG